MHLVLLGNGYDLSYHLPTSYRNFLLTIKFILTHQFDDIHTIGDIFGHKDLTSQDQFINESFEEYKDTYNSIAINLSDLNTLKRLAQNNIWYEYFLNTFNKDIGWVDFEKEISFVIKSFLIFFENNSTIYVPHRLGDKSTEYILCTAFSFFQKHHSTNRDPLNIGTETVSREYCIEYPLGSKNYIINKEKIVDHLYSQLLDLADLLSCYLKIFVKATVASLKSQNIINQHSYLTFADTVITFNYTDTFEILTPSTKVHHIHGDLNNEIILGVNPDETDYVATINTDFLKFKKYFQRVFYSTDTEYLNVVETLERFRDCSPGSTLIVMGHSLDVTDQDIIKELFDLVHSITVCYHNQTSLTSLINNLIKIYGKEGFDSLRRDKCLKFLDQTQID